MAAELPANAPRAVALAQHVDTTRLGHGQMFAISAMWFALSVVWGGLLTLVVPTQVEDILRRQGLSSAEVTAQKGLFVGLVIAAGAVIALVVPPLVGAYSDQSTHRMGRRRPFVLVGVLITLAGLLGMITPPSMLIYGVFYLLLQFGSNTAVAAYQGLIPDLVPEQQRGHASGWLGMMTITGNIVGLLLGSVGLARAHSEDLLTAGQQWLVYGVIIAILVVFLGITLFGVRETPLAATTPRAGLGAILKSLWIDPRRYPDFAWVWITRFLVTMGFNTVQFFLLYFLQDVIGIGRDKLSTYGGFMFLGLLLSAAVTSIVSGRISDRKGRKPLIYAAGGIMALMGVAFIFLSTLPTPGFFPEAAFNTVFYIGIGFGIGYGTYQAVDWALGTDVLPNKETGAAKDMGVWHISFVLPQVLATLISGWLLYAFAAFEPTTRYGLVFAASILYFILGTVLVRNVRGAR
jgi:MFS family permease